MLVTEGGEETADFFLAVLVNRNRIPIDLTLHQKGQLPTTARFDNGLAARWNDDDDDFNFHPSTFPQC